MCSTIVANISRLRGKFGRGPRSCIGKNVSLMEMKKLIPELVLRFEIDIVDPDREWVVHNDWFVQQQDFLVRLSERRL